MALSKIARFIKELKKVHSSVEVAEEIKEKSGYFYKEGSFAIANSGTIAVKIDDDIKRMLLSKKIALSIQEEKIYKDLFEAFERENFLSSYIFITGPSRTADIEKITILGVHGPGEVLVVIQKI